MMQIQVMEVRDLYSDSLISLSTHLAGAG
jgi:hypothetical protein